jgi:hypothetical protein
MSSYRARHLSVTRFALTMNEDAFFRGSDVRDARVLDALLGKRWVGGRRCDAAHDLQGIRTGPEPQENLALLAFAAVSKLIIATPYEVVRPGVADD